MKNPTNCNLETFIKLLKASDGVKVNDDVVLIGKHVIYPLNGNAGNEVVTIENYSHDCDITYVFTEKSLSDGEFKQNGDFVCEDHNGEDIRLTFVKINIITEKNLPDKSSELFYLASKNWTTDEKQHALLNIDSKYGIENEIPLESRRIICCGHNEELGYYIRIVDKGFEVSRWIDSEWRNVPIDVMTAILEMLYKPNRIGPHSGTTQVSLELYEFDDDVKTIGSKESVMTLAEITEIIEFASQLVLFYRKNGVVDENTINQIDNALVGAEIIDENLR